jgi:hypothetical protein
VESAQISEYSHEQHRATPLRHKQILEMALETLGFEIAGTGLFGGWVIWHAWNSKANLSFAIRTK